MNHNPYAWVQTQPLNSVMLRFLRFQDKGALSSVLLGQLANRLIATETTPGGPYAESGQPPNPTTNALIARFFRQLGTPLPNLNIYDRPLEKPAQNPTIRRNAVQQAISAELTHFDATFGSLPLALFQKIAATDRNGELSRLTELFANSLAGYFPDSEQLFRLGEANFYAWMAYALYDHLTDDDLDSRNSICLANHLLRRAILRYGPEYQTLITTYFDRTDVAIHRELLTARAVTTAGVITIPEYLPIPKVAEKSLAHIIGPMIVCHLAGLNSLKQALVERAFIHYLTARQFNDDLKDWKDDLAHGHLSPVVCRLLQAAKIITGIHSVSILSAQLEQVFWESQLNILCEEVEGHIAAAKELLTIAVGMRSDSPFCTQVLDPLSQSAQQARSVHYEQQQFLKSYTET